MATAEQVTANRANARKSTGPVSVAGKKVTCLNARKHGMTGQVVLRTPEEDAAYELYSSHMMADLRPAGAIEYCFAVRIIADTWKLEQAQSTERSLYQLSESEIVFESGDPERDRPLNDAITFQVKEKTFSLMSLYMARIQRGLHKDIEMLRKMQKERRAEQLAEAKQAIAAQRQAAKAAAEATKTAPQVVEMPAPQPEIGSVFSAPPADSAPPPPATQTTSENMAA